MRCWTIVAMMGVLPANVAADTMPRFSVAAVRSDVAAGARIGRLGAGALCVRAGPVVWREVSPRASATAAIARTLRDGQIDVRVAEDDGLDTPLPPTRYRVVATITHAAVSLCAPQWGIVRRLTSRRTLKGTAVVQVHWRIFDTASRSVVAATDTECSVPVRQDSLALDAVLIPALVESARRAVPAIVAIDRP